MEILIVLLLVLVLVTLVGHGIWVLIALLFGGGRRTPSQQPAPSARMELTAADNQVRRLFREGRISLLAYQELTTAIAAEHTGVRPSVQLPPSAERSAATGTAGVAGGGFRPPPMPVRPLQPPPFVVVDETTEPAGWADAAATIEVDEVEDAGHTHGEDGSEAPVVSVGDAEGSAEHAPADPPPFPVIAPEQIPPPAPKPVIARPPRRPWSEVLAAFMEQKNIRWGELMGGLLIIGCTVALVLSFWNDIAHRPVLKFSIFTAVTGALFGLGLYTEHRWRLPTTSRGVLLIATLLVPLNFLAFAALAAGERAAQAVAIAGQTIAFGLFLWLSHAAAKVLAPRWPALLAGTVLGLSALSLAVRYVAPEADALAKPTLFLLAGLPLAGFALAHALMLIRARRCDPFDADAGQAVLLFVGVASFAAIFPVGLALSRSGDPTAAARQLAPLLGLAGISLLASGVLLWRRITDAALVNLRTAGTAVGVLGAAVMVAGVALAWPHPAGMLAASVLAWIATATISLRLRVPSAQALAAPCAVLAYLLGFHLIAGYVGWTSDSEQLRRVLLLPSGGTALAGLVFAFALAGELFYRRERHDDANSYRISAALTGMLSLILATAGGFARPHDPYGLTWLYAAYAAGSFYVAWRYFRQRAAWVGWALLLATAAQALLSRSASVDAWTLALLGTATAAGTMAVMAALRGGRRAHVLSGPAQAILTATSLAAAVMLVANATLASADVVALRLAWLAALWLTLAVAEGSAVWFLTAQTALTFAVAFAVVGRLATREWFAQSPHPLLDPWALQAIGVAVALLTIVWSAIRWAALSLTPPTTPGAERSDAADPANVNLSSPPRVDDGVAAQPLARWRRSALALARMPWSIDRWVTLGIGVGLFAMAAWAATPAIANELGLASAPLGQARPSVAQVHAMGIGAWAVLLALLVTAALAIREGFGVWGVQGAMTIAWAGCLLVAARAWPTDAGASAMRWCSAGYLMLGAGTALLLRRLARRGKAHAVADPPAYLAAKPVLILLGVLPVLVFSALPLLTILSNNSLTGPDSLSGFSRIGPAVSYAVPLAAVVGLLIAGAIRRRSDGRALAALLASDLAAAVVYVMSAVPRDEYIVPAQWVRLAHLLVAATAAGALGWTALLRRDARRRGQDARPPIALTACVVSALTAMLLLAASAGNTLFWNADGGADIDRIRQFGDVWAWAALGAVTLAAASRFVPRRPLPSLGTPAIAMAVAAAMAAFTAAHRDRGDWLAFHVWLAAHATAGWAMLALGWVIDRGRRGFAEMSPLGASPAVPIVAVEPVTLAIEYQRAETSADPAPLPIAPQVVYAGLDDVRHAAARWAVALGVFGLALALRAMLGDPWMPWSSVAVIGAFGLLTTTIACWLGRPGYLYSSSLLLNLGATLWWFGDPLNLPGDWLASLILINVIALAAPALAWLVLELQVFARSPAAPNARPAPRWRSVPVHRAAAAVSLAALALVPATGVLSDLSFGTFRADPMLSWAAVASVVALWAGNLWDRKARHPLAGLYVVGLVALLTALDQLDLASGRVPWAAGVLLGGYTLLTALLYAVRQALTKFAGESVSLGRADWLIPTTGAIVVVVLALALGSDFTIGSQGRRLAAAAAAMAQVATIALLAHGRARPQRFDAKRAMGTAGAPASAGDVEQAEHAGDIPALRVHALHVAVFSAILFAWAWPGPFAFDDLRARVTHGTLAVAVLALAVAALYAFGVAQAEPSRRAGGWRAAGRAAFAPVLALAVVALLFTFGMEAAQFIASTTLPKRAAMHPAGIAVMLLALAGSCATALWWALAPRRDPFGLSERGRMGYVYAAEALAALAYGHIKLTCPPILPSFFVRFWPLVVTAICLAGVGAGEVFRRQGRRVLHEPLERTGLFLPLLVVVAFWFIPSEAHYSAVLLAAGAVYALASVLRRSFAFGLLAALAGNGALWYLLHRSANLGLFHHPQLWIIPTALSVLAAAQLNRDRLPPEQLRTIRYLSLIALYVSSTADIFLNAATPSPWLPMLLAVLSVAGVLAGVVYRIRPFLFVGTLFLAFAVGAMIWNAQVNLGWTWLWYVAGIVLGLMILALFAVFEKRRTEMLAMLEGLRAWE